MNRAFWLALCNATRVIIQDASWPLRNQLLEEIRRILSHIPPRAAYYPGALERHQRFIQEHPESEHIGLPSGQELPWTLIAGVNPESVDDVCFTTEAFCSLFAETALEAESVSEYIDKAVAFANQHIWGRSMLRLLCILHL
jgi:hypothetical protein